MIRIVFALAVTALLAGVQPAAAERIALVIGNSAYEHVPELTNPKNDAADIAARLKSIGFEVIEGRDLTLIELRRTVRDFINALSDAKLGLFYYAGHGLQVNGKNYLAPVDARLETYDDLDFEAFPIEMILAAMERKTKTNLVFLDACRNSPLARNLARSMGTRSTDVGRGLARISSGVGTLISFSTQPGNIALDGVGRNSPFTSALVKHIGTPGEDVTVTLRRVRRDVISETNGKQVPWSNSSLTGPVVLKAKPDAGKGDSVQVRAPSYDETMVRDYALAERVGTVAAWDAFMARHAGAGDTILGKLAKEKRKALMELENTSAPPPQTETAKLRPQPPQKQLPKGSLNSPAPEIAAAGDKPLELGREKRRQVQLALAELGHDPGPADGQFGPRTDAAINAARRSLGLPAGNHVDQMLLDRLPDVSDQTTEADRTLAMEVQRTLKRAGCYTGPIDGDWGPGSISAVERFNQIKGLRLPSTTPNTELLQAVNRNRGKACLTAANLQPDTTETNRPDPTGNSVERFNGYWKFTKRSASPAKCAGWTVISKSFVIDQGNVRALNETKDGGTYRGKITAKGSIKFTQSFTYNGEKRKNYYSGKFKGNQVSGTFGNPRRGCRGTFTLTKS